MMSTPLVIALGVAVILVASTLSVRREPPFWTVLLVCVAAYPIGSALLRLPALADAGLGTVGEWTVRLAVVSVGTALLGLALGRLRRRERDRAPEPAEG
ncbi:hypothetical protein NFX46_15920 [Streptomyces phaeoluteigriseus]|uniref:Integral membrane protein n=1 Tax=Streptomyces phaeoluteigriseus TaxID=114686 RepID=A0ABY4Z8M2_9ACTN|nr:hypothetical protein [Streptomyces phaeoluteigriseus]USQ85144.1 hypothetical protein NFX46_15920 [Streptomyces phaeoluteigriseus]